MILKLNGKSFFVTVDTEGDNMWSMPSKIETNNAAYLEPFQVLCNKFNFKPIYLTNYEMMCSEVFVEIAQYYLKKKQCEIGMHLHAWSMPPMIELKKGKKYHNAYLLEYPPNIMEEKIKIMTRGLEETFQCSISTHRAGRWATNKQYFYLLEKYGYKFDCSYTPFVSWNKHVGYTEGSRGSDYRHVCKGIHQPYENCSIIEVPMTIRKRRTSFEMSCSAKGNLRALRNSIFGTASWLRPNGKNLSEMLELIEICQNDDYLEFMIHSSELMPKGNPTFRTEEDIKKLYEDLEKLFNIVKSKGYVGKTFQDIKGEI